MQGLIPLFPSNILPLDIRTAYCMMNFKFKVKKFMGKS